MALLALAVAIAYALPFDTRLTTFSLIALRSRATVSIAGNSALTHVSKCDSDQRTIASMLSAELGRQVLDLSFPGQVLTETDNLVALSLRNASTRTVVLPVSMFALLEWDVVPIRTYAAFRLLNPWLEAGSLSERFTAADWYERELAVTKQPYQFGEVQYPDYNSVKRDYLSAESDAQGCPETDGHDMAFIASNYWHEYVQLPYQTQYFAVFASLDRYARRHRKTLELVLLPVDFDLIGKLLPEDIASLHARIANMAAQLRDLGLNVIDMTGASPNDEFVDRWCACGHLGEAGRLRVARRITQGIVEQLQASAAPP